MKGLEMNLRDSFVCRAGWSLLMAAMVVLHLARLVAYDNQHGLPSIDHIVLSFIRIIALTISLPGLIMVTVRLVKHNWETAPIEDPALQKSVH